MTIVTGKTKDKNTFRFKSFGDRVNDIDIRRSALYHIGHINEELTASDETYFHQTLKKWNVLNLTDEYNVFSRKCQKIITLPQLIHQKDFVVDLLLERLSIATTLSLQPLLELLYVLAKDLREDFYPYFQRVLERLICLLNTQDAEQLEWTLVCLAYLFKTLKPYLKKNIGLVFYIILPLLDEQLYPEHITNFAVECFSFIARDIRDYRKFLDFILETVQKEQSDCVQGCGRLLFEIVRGIKGMFHSIAGDFLEFIFQYQTNEDKRSPQQTSLLNEIIKYAVANLLQFIHPQQMGLFWQKLCSVLQNLKSFGKMEYLIEVFLMALEYKDGRYLNEIQLVVPCLLTMLDRSMAKEELSSALSLSSQCVTKMLLSGNTMITQLDTSRLLKKTLTITNRQVYEEFICSIAPHTQFEILILPKLIAYFETHFDDQAFDVLTKIVLMKQPLARNSLALEQWKPYCLALKNQSTADKINQMLKDFSFKDKPIERQALILILAPHFIGIDKSLLHGKLKSEAERLLKDLERPKEKNLLLLGLIVETSIHLQMHWDKRLMEMLFKALLPYDCNLNTLNILNQILWQATTINKTYLNNLSEILVPYLSSHSHEVRLITAHNLKLLSKHEKEVNPYQLMYEIETIELNVHTYRSQILLLQKFEVQSEFYKSMKNPQYKKHIVYHLLGLLYNNFKLIWEPVLKLLEAYAKELEMQEFWLIFKARLIQATQDIEMNIKSQDEVKQQPSIDWGSEESSSSLNSLLPSEHVQAMNQATVLNYRLLLWQALANLNHLTEIKNREIIPIFFEFIEREYRPNVEKQQFTMDLRPKSSLPKTSELNEKESKDFTWLYVDNTKRTAYIKAILQTLQAQLKCFVHQPNPKALYREPDLYNFYMDLIAGPNLFLQKLALDCVYAYKSKKLLSYKDNLDNFVEEKTFKNELTSFKIDGIAPEARDEIMQILLRILHSKLITKGSLKQMKPQARKAMILRFLGQCTMDEILWFLQMSFGNVNLYTKEEMLDIPSKLQSEFDLKAVWSSSKLKNIINLMELIRKEFGGLMQPEFHLYILKLILFVGSVCHQVMSIEVEQLHQNMHLVYKNIKNDALQSLVNFFDHITGFEWSPQYIQIFTEVFVHPSLEKLPQESIHSPTVLLKLLLKWSENVKYYENLTQVYKGKVLFAYVIEVLENERSKPPVRKAILEMIERLLLAAQDNVAPLGLELVKPFIPQILTNIKQITMKRKKKQGIDSLELRILSLLTSYIEDSQTCDSLLDILLPILLKKIQSKIPDDITIQIMTTITNLIKRLDTPLIYLRRVAPLFEHIQEISSRKMLCELVSQIAKKTMKMQSQDPEVCEQMKQIGRFVLMLNAWDKRWVEQPDYDKRLTALKEITLLLQESKVEMNLGLLAIYNCFYYLKYDKDMGLRDNASELLQELLPNLVAKYADNKRELHYLVGEVFLNLVIRVLQDSNENVRNEGIRLLGVMARKCSSAHEILMDLSPLGDEQDPEVDFFENLIHLQSHRHGRALLKFCSHSATLKRPPHARTLTQFILPLAARYLLNEKHASKHTLVDAAIDCVGIVCQLLPWQHYHAILRYYLTKMRHAHEHQKQSVRIVVKILDAFHFDVSQAPQAKAEELQKMKTALNDGVMPKKEPSTSAATEKQTKANAKKNQKENKENENENDKGAGDDDNEIEFEDKEQPQIDQDSAHSDDDDDDNEDDDDNDDDENSEEDDALDFTENPEETLEPDDKEAVNQSDSLDPILDKPLLLSPVAARKVITTITSVLIPMLNRSITEKSSYDNKHKVNRKRLSYEREEEEILRVPIALALVKLMQKLPKEILDSGVSGVFMKVCTFLRSPLKSVRMLTRDILKKIMLTLGPSYLASLMEHLQSLLTRGFQVHVLSVTVHGVLDALKMIVQPEDIASCLHNLLEVALNDIFGSVNAEKEVDKIVAHTPEAKTSSKSYLILHILARNIPESCLLDLLLPFKDHLAKSHSKKLIVKIQDCFGKIVGGLVENAHISREALLIFIYGTMSESITDLLPGVQKRVLSEKEKETMRRARPDCFIIPQAPRMRSGVINKNIKTNSQANAHILVEFGLEMLHFVLKRKKLVEVTYQPFVNPILPLLKDSLKSTHIRVTTFALKCLSAIWNDEYDLPALKEFLPEIVARMFEILKNFSSFGATKQEDNNNLVKSTFKAVVALLRKCEDYELTEEQIDQLLLYIEQDFQEGENQTICFTLLKAMLNRKIDTPALHEIMKRIGDLCIISDLEYVREECRNLLIFYIIEYPLKKKIEQIIKNFSAQLCYSVASGRKSAIAIFHAIIKKFPLPILSKHAEFLYLSLSTRLINDEDPECRKDIAETLEMLISRLSKPDRQRLFDLTVVFFEAKKNKPSVREMAAAMVIRFVNVEKQAFESRVKLILPTVVARLTLDNPSAPGRFVRLPTKNPEEDESPAISKKKAKKSAKGHLNGDLMDDEVEAEILSEERQRALDHELIQMQFCILKILEHCLDKILDNKDLCHTIDELAYESQRLLNHDHSWVRCNAAKIINALIANYDFNLVAQKLSKIPVDQSTSLDFIYLNPEYDIKALILDICAQFVPGETSSQMIDEIVKLFLFVGNMLRDIPFTIKKEKIKVEDTEDNETTRTTTALTTNDDNEKTELATLQSSKIHLGWLVHNMRFLINKEVAKAAHSTGMRSAMFTLIEGFVTLLSVEMVEKLTPAFLSVLVREMSEEDQNVDADLRQKALHVGSRLRKRITPAIYDKLRTQAQTNLMIRRAERKKVIAQEKIHDPVQAAKRKLNMQERKKVMKKRKMEVMRGKAQDVKQKLKKRKRKAEDDIF